MIRCRPVEMTTKYRADDPAVQNSLERFVFFLRFPLSDDLAARSRFIGVLQQTTNMQAVRVCRAATEAHILRRVFFLKGLFGVHRFFLFRFLSLFILSRERRS